MSEPDKPDARIVPDLVERIRPILAGNHPSVQSAALADLLSMWLAGHFAGSDEETNDLRNELLAEHIKLVRDLTPANEAMILERARKG